MTTIYVKSKDGLPKRRELDFYTTEPNLICAAMERYLWGVQGRKSVLDLGAGDGRWGGITARVIAETRSPLPTLTGIEKRQDAKPAYPFDRWIVGDYLTEKIEGTFDIIVSNPPYYAAEQFIRRAITEHLSPNGIAVFLLPIQFMCGVKRYEKLWNELYVWRCDPIVRRPSFYGGGTNGTDYAIFVWLKEDGRLEGSPNCWAGRSLYYDR